jgi:hypothetical protein
MVAVSQCQRCRERVELREKRANSEIAVDIARDEGSAESHVDGVVGPSRERVEARRASARAPSGPSTINCVRSRICASRSHGAKEYTNANVRARSRAPQVMRFARRGRHAVLALADESTPGQRFSRIDPR